MLKINSKMASLFAIAYLTIPIIIFLFTWCKIYVSIISTSLLIASTYIFYKNLKSESKEANYLDIFFSILVIIIFLILSGQCGIIAQTFDNNVRNAIFHDLINHEWPVKYNDSALTYYFLFWLIPSLIGKITGSWTLANYALLIWCGIGLELTVIFLSFMTKKINLLLFSVLFSILSAPNIVGIIFTHGLDLVNIPFSFSSNEGWCDGQDNGFDSSYLYRSTYDAVSQTYNQAIPSFLIGSLFLYFKNKFQCIFIFSLLFTYAPIPALGLVFYFVILFFNEIRQNNLNYEYIKKYINLCNILIIFSIIPIFGTFYSNTSDSFFGWYIPFEAYTVRRIIKLLIFYFIEFGWAYLLLSNKYKKNIYCVSALISLIIYPFFRVGAERDFVMNASFFSLLIIYQFLFLSFYDSIYDKTIKFSRNILVYLCLCSTTIVFGSHLMMRVAHEQKKQDPSRTVFYLDDLKTIANLDRNWHYFSKSYNSLFYLYFSK